MPWDRLCAGLWPRLTGDAARLLAGAPDSSPKSETPSPKADFARRRQVSGGAQLPNPLTNRAPPARSRRLRVGRVRCGAAFGTRFWAFRPTAWVFASSQAPPLFASGWHSASLGCRWLGCCSFVARVCQPALRWIVRAWGAAGRLADWETCATAPPRQPSGGLPPITRRCAVAGSEAASRLDLPRPLPAAFAGAPCPKPALCLGRFDPPDAKRIHRHASWLGERRPRTSLP
jgi:hypothetical protein